MADAPLPLGTKTPWGTVQAVGIRDGERFYMMTDKRGTVTLMPDVLAEYPRFRDACKESYRDRP